MFRAEIVSGVARNQELVWLRKNKFEHVAAAKTIEMKITKFWGEYQDC